MILLGFVGVVLLLKPSFAKQDLAAGAVGLLSGFGAALAYAHVKQLGNLGEPDWRTVFYFTLISTFASGFWMLLQTYTSMSLQDMPTLLGLGVSATIAQLAMTRAYRTGITLTVASLAYTTVIFASLFGVLFWQETLSYSEYMAIGIIIFSGIVSANATNRAK
jgi:drug/metabolite transporter (DMT)-like permease